MKGVGWSTLEESTRPLQRGSWCKLLVDSTAYNLSPAGGLQALVAYMTKRSLVRVQRAGRPVLPRLGAGAHVPWLQDHLPDANRRLRPRAPNISTGSGPSLEATSSRLEPWRKVPEDLSASAWQALMESVDYCPMGNTLLRHLGVSPSRHPFSDVALRKVSSS